MFRFGKEPFKPTDQREVEIISHFFIFGRYTELGLWVGALNKALGVGLWGGKRKILLGQGK